MLESFGTLYGTLRYHYRPALLFYVIFMARRLFFALAIVYLGDYQILQVNIFMFGSIAISMFLWRIKPFAIQAINYLEILNESSILVSGYLLNSCTDYNSNYQLKYSLGWIMIILSVLNIAINLSLNLYFTVKRVIQIIRKKCTKKSRKGIHTPYKQNSGKEFPQTQIQEGESQLGAYSFRSNSNNDVPFETPAITFSRPIENSKRPIMLQNLARNPPTREERLDFEQLRIRRLKLMMNMKD